MATITSARPESPASLNRNTASSPPISHSPSATPSSSVRPSIDLQTTPNGRTASPSSATNPTQLVPPSDQSQTQRRNRAALRDYYNLKSKGQASATQPERGSISRASSIASTSTTITTHDPTTQPNGIPAYILPPSLDDPTFDLDSYVQHLLRTSSLQQLLKTEATLISEIKQLDGERKALVYDNYSKLIGATTMIEQMQRGMNEGIETDGPMTTSVLGGRSGMGKAGGGKGGLKEVEKVNGMVEDIARIAADLRRDTDRDNGKNPGTADAERSKKTEKRRLVRWVVEAPKRFEDASDNDRADEILAEWEKLQPILQTWKGVKGVQDVREQCQIIVNELTARLQNGAREPDAEHG